MFKHLALVVAFLWLTAPRSSAQYTLSMDDLKNAQPSPAESCPSAPFDVTGTEFWDEELGDIFVAGIVDPDNLATKITLPARRSTLTAIGWDLVQTSFSPSWGSEQVIAFDTDQDGPIDLTLTPSGTGAPIMAEPNSSGGVIKLADAGIPDLPTPTGFMDLYFIDTFEDFPDAPDGVIDQGVLLFCVPEPTSVRWLVLALLGLGNLAGRLRGGTRNTLSSL